MKPNTTNGIMLLCDSETLANRIRGLMQVRWQKKVRVDYAAPFVHVSWLPEANDFKENITTKRIKDWLMAIINKQITVINFQLFGSKEEHDTLKRCLRGLDLAFSVRGNCYTAFFIGSLELFQGTLNIQLKEDYGIVNKIDFEFPAMI